jgi:hypothetical protein
MADKLNYGHNAALSRSLLPNDQIRELFDWSSAKFRESNVFLPSLIQSFACRWPNSPYWDLVNHARKVMESPDFKEVQEKALARAIDNLTRGPDA